MKIILVRHGQSIGNTKKGFISGRSDPDGLTERGKIQIIRTAYELRNEKIDHILSSPVVRAQETTQILNTYFNQEVTTEEFLTELHHGVLEGSYWWEVIDQIPPNWRKNREDYTSPYPGGGESMEMLLLRAWKTVQHILSSYDERSTILIVSHQAVIAALRYVFTHGDPSQFTTQSQIDDCLQFIHNTMLPNGGITKMIYEHQKVRSISEIIDFSPLKMENNTALFYFRGLFKLTEKNIPIETLTTVSSNVVYQVSHNGSYILKILLDKSEKSAERQAALYRYLQEKKIAAPQIKIYDNSEIFYKAPIFVQDFVQGANQGVCLTHYPTEMPKLLEEIYQVIERIHELPVEEVHHFWFPPGDKHFQNWKTYMQYNINLTIDYLKGSSFLEKEKATLIDKLKKVRAYVEGDSYSYVPLHGDLAPENIIANHKDDECNLTRIIDFEWARIGDPLWDFAYYGGWLERDNALVSTYWQKLLKRKLSKEKFTIIQLYQVLFHAWTMRDMSEYKGNQTRKARGMRSEEILRALLET